ncbi:MAG: formylglycine-generating enzyme family protein [Candidatus Limnocylindria bacterium]
MRQPENRPVIRVTWHDAQAFCVWLMQRWQNRLPEDWRVTLPSEAEWEKAARGGVRVPVTVQVATAEQGFSSVMAELDDNPGPQRAYPWGDDFRADHANAKGNVGSPSTPGCFVRGQSPYGCLDMSGNVWEWTRSLWGRDWRKPGFAYPYDPDDPERENLDAGDDVFRVVRGGSWLGSRVNARCAFRLRNLPDHRYDPVGFRVVLRTAPVRSDL